MDKGQWGNKNKLHMSKANVINANINKLYIVPL